MAVVASNIKLEPVNVFLGRREKTTVTCVADVADSLDGTYFTLASAGNASNTHYIWLNTAGAAVDPAPAGLTGIEVSITTGDSASVVAAAIVTALASDANFNAVSSGAVVTIENADIGTALAVADVDTGFTIAQAVVGAKTDLGGTREGAEISFESEEVDVLADQLGGTILDRIQRSVNASLTLSLLEMTATKWDLIVGGMTGKSVTPSGGTLVTGLGEDRRFVNMSSVSYELQLQPVGAADRSRDITLWKTFAKPTSVNYNSSDLQGMAVSYTHLTLPTKRIV